MSSIGYGGTRAFSNMWYFCEVNLCVTILWYFCVGLLVAGGGGGLYGSSIGYGGTRAFSNMWYFCEVNLCVTILWYFCVGLLVAGGFYMVLLAYDNGMVPR